MYFVVALNIVNILIITAAGFMMPLWGDFVQRIGGDVRTAGNAICIFSIVIGLLTILAGRIEDKYNKNEFFVVFAQFIMMLAYAGYFFVVHPWQLYLIQFVLGLAGAFQAPAIYSLYHRYIPATKNSSYWGAWAGFYNISIGIGALFAAYIVHHFGFNTMFTLLFCIAFVGFVVSLVVMSQIKKEAVA